MPAFLVLITDATRLGGIRVKLPWILGPDYELQVCVGLPNSNFFLLRPHYNTFNTLQYYTKCAPKTERG